VNEIFIARLLSKLNGGNIIKAALKAFDYK
jgi:hypothetical protein